MTAWSLVAKIALGAGLLGATAGVVGAYAVLRRRALLGDVLAHAALPGVCLAFLVTGLRETLPLSLGALASGLAGVACVALLVRWTRTREDAAMGIVLSTFFGFGVLLLTVIQNRGSGAQAGLDSYLFGEVASLTWADVSAMAVATLLACGACVALHKELKLYCFDEGFARSQGWPIAWFDAAIMSAVATVVVLGLPVCGVVLIAAMLIYPAAAARYWTHRLAWVVAIAALVGAVAGAGGVLLASPGVAGSLWRHLAPGGRGALPPPGPVIVLLGSLLFLASALFAPARGVLASARRQSRLRARIQREHLLRSLYEIAEQRNELNQATLSPTPQAELSGRYTAGPWTSWRTIAAAERAGLVDTPGESIVLTTEGFAEATRLTRVHRLWELYLLRQADIAADHVDRDADDVEHLLPVEVIEQLESELSAAGDPPPSPHRIET